MAAIQDIPNSVLAVTPALKPPPGVIPDFSGHRGLQTTWIVIDSIALFLTTLIVSARIITKTVGKERFQIEDCKPSAFFDATVRSLTLGRFCGRRLGLSYVSTRSTGTIVLIQISGVFHSIQCLVVANRRARTGPSSMGHKRSTNDRYSLCKLRQSPKL